MYVENFQKQARFFRSSQDARNYLFYLPGAVDFHVIPVHNMENVPQSWIDDIAPLTTTPWGWGFQDGHLHFYASNPDDAHEIQLMVAQLILAQ